MRATIPVESGKAQVLTLPSQAGRITDRWVKNCPGRNPLLSLTRQPGQCKGHAAMPRAVQGEFCIFEWNVLTLLRFQMATPNAVKMAKYLTKNSWEVSYLAFFGTKIRSVNVSKFCEWFHVVLMYYSSSHQLDKLEERSTGSRDGSRNEPPWIFRWKTKP